MSDFYTFNSNDYVDFSLPLLSTMSLSQYDKLTPYMGLTLNRSDDILHVARQTSMYAWNLMGGQFDFPSMIIESQLTFQDIWEITIAHLARINQSNEVIKTLDKVKKEQQTYQSRLLGSSWNAIWIDWLNEPNAFSSIGILDEHEKWLKSYLNEQYMTEERVKRTVPLSILDQDGLDAWDKYVLLDARVYLWINNRAKLHHNISKWQAILDKITPDEIKNIDDWGLKLVEKFNYGLYRHFSISRLATDFRSDGLISDM